MRSFSEIEKKLANELPVLQQRFHVKKIGIFGSYVRGTATDKSDLDVLVEFSKTPEMIRFFHLEAYLKNLLGINIDLVTRKALKPKIGERILAEVLYV